MANRAGVQARSFRLWATALGLGVLTLNLATAVSASTKHHHHHDSGSDDESSSRREARLHKLAMREKAAWRKHLKKLHHLSSDEKLVLAHHRHREKIRQMLAEEEAIDQARLRHHRHHSSTSDDDAPTPRHRHHLSSDDTADAPPPKHRHHHASSDDADQAPPRHHKHSADSGSSDSESTHHRHVATSRAEHEARLAAHNERLYRQEANHHARMVKIAAIRKARHDHALAMHNARLAAHAQRIAAAALKHNAKVTAKLAKKAKDASKGSAYVAQHGDDSSGRAIKFWQTVAVNIPVKVITVDLNNSNVKVSAVMSRNGDGTSEPFKQMIERSNPNVAVTGTFFSLDNLKPVGDIVIDGSLVHFGGMGTALCVTPNNKAEMVTCSWGRHHDWTPYDFVCACGPRLLHKSAVVLDPHAERFKDRHMLAPNSRIAVGITPGNKLVFAMTREPIYLGRLAKVMKNLGCAEAMNLDAGTSTGFYYNGTTLARPGRKLTNMIVVYGRKDRYQRAIQQLCPPTYRRGDRTARRLSKVDPAPSTTPIAAAAIVPVDATQHLAAFDTSKAK